MNETIIGQTRWNKQDQWREQMAKQERSGLSVKQFCREHGLAECSFYVWRKRLRKMLEPVRFALVERKGMMRQEPAGDAPLELVLLTGVRLRIGAGVDSTILRTVLEALHV